MFEDEGARLRQLARDKEVKISYTSHARNERMKEYGIPIIEIPPLLTRCKIVDVQPGTGSVDRWVAEGRLRTDNRLVHIVVEADEGAIRILVITVIDKSVNKHR